MPFSVQSWCANDVCVYKYIFSHSIDNDMQKSFKESFMMFKGTSPLKTMYWLVQQVRKRDQVKRFSVKIDNWLWLYIRFVDWPLERWLGWVQHSWAVHSAVKFQHTQYIHVVCHISPRAVHAHCMCHVIQCTWKTEKEENNLIWNA